MRSNLGALPWHALGRAGWSSALEIYQRLADVASQHHRAVGFADILIAVSAEDASWPLVHYDQDFDAIAEVTAQPMRWVAPRRTL